MRHYVVIKKGKELSSNKSFPRLLAWVSKCYRYDINYSNAVTKMCNFMHLLFWSDRGHIWILKCNENISFLQKTSKCIHSEYASKIVCIWNFYEVIYKIIAYGVNIWIWPIYANWIIFCRPILIRLGSNVETYGICNKCQFIPLIWHL